MTPLGAGKRAAGLLLAALVASLARRWPGEGTAGRDGPPAPCLLFVFPGHGMHSNQLLVAARVAGLARLLGCRVLPLFLSHGPARDRGWARHGVPMGAFYAPSDVFADLDDAADAGWVRRLAAGAGSPAAGASAGPVADRAALGLHQDANSRRLLLHLPCLVGPHSLGDPRFERFRQPFACSDRIVLPPAVSHGVAYPEREARAALAALRARLAGRLIGVPQPFMFNLSCTLEQAGAAEVPARGELLRAAKWILWHGVLSGPPWRGLDNGAWEQRLLDELARTPEIPYLDSPAYSSYPSPAPALYTGHVRTGPSITTTCAHRLRFPLCATTQAMAADALSEAVQGWRALGARGTLALFVAGDTIHPPNETRINAATDQGTQEELVARMAGVAEEGPAPLVRYGGAMKRIYRAVLSHPSLNLTDHTVMPLRHGAEREAAFWDVAGIVLDQILLGCGDRVSSSSGNPGAYLQTYWSTFSMQSRLLGATVGREACLPSSWPADPAPPPELSTAEWDAQDRELRRAGVDFTLDHAHPGGPRRTYPAREWMVGCAAKGNFFPSQTFRERVESERECAWCWTNGSRW